MHWHNKPNQFWGERNPPPNFKSNFYGNFTVLENISKMCGVNGTRISTSAHWYIVRIINHIECILLLGKFFTNKLSAIVHFTKPREWIRDYTMTQLADTIAKRSNVKPIWYPLYIIYDTFGISFTSHKLHQIIIILYCICTE